MVKRVSTDEKLTKIVNFFKTTQDLYCIKDLEKKLPKECGISSMLVPDLLKKLLEENMIRMEKCGASNIYWCFPYQEHHACQCETEKYALAIESFREENEKKEKQLEKLISTKENAPELEGLQKEYTKLKAKASKIELEKKLVSECPLADYKALLSEKEEFTKKVNKLTDDIFTIQAYMSSKFSLPRKDFNKSFSIDDDMDYLN